MNGYLSSGPRLALNTPAVACQIIDGGAIVIHFDRGNYYSVEGSGVVVLELVSGGAHQDEIGAALAERFDIDIDRATSSGRRFLEELLAEDLVVTSHAPPQAPAPSPPASTPSRRPFEEPRLVKYSDLQDLLVLDPIHDIILKGWPAKAG
jgi:hypothetical protein